MFSILPCSTIKDAVTLTPVGDITKLAPQMDKIRQQIKKLSDTEYLIEQIRQGQVMMTKKVGFDNYLKSQVDLMKAYVMANTSCSFYYNGFLTSEPISTINSNIKQQWAIEIIMSRYNICSIYHAGAYGSLEKIFNETVNSYNPDFKGMAELTKNLQICFKYFNQGYQPLKRLSTVYLSLEQLMTPEKKEQNPELKKEVFEMYRDVVECNLAYLKLEKYRILSEFKVCKEGGYSVYLRLLDLQKKLNQYLNKPETNQDLKVFISLGEIFYKIYFLFFMLLEHDHNKIKQDYGFIKKQFQQMIVDNLAAIEEIQKTKIRLDNFPKGDQLDNVIFARMVIDAMMGQVKKMKYKYDINIHENAIEKPDINEIIARNIGSRQIWGSLVQF